MVGAPGVVVECHIHIDIHEGVYVYKRVVLCISSIQALWLASRTCAGKTPLIGLALSGLMSLVPRRLKKKPPAPKPVRTAPETRPLLSGNHFQPVGWGVDGGRYALLS